MKRRTFLGAALAALGTSAAAEPLMQLHEVARDLPALSVMDGEGQALTLADFRGRVVLLNVWATWCVPCREEMPTLDALQAQLGGPDFQVLPLSMDRAGADAVQPFYEEIGIENLGVYLSDQRQAMSALGILGLPTTLLIDREGREIARLIGPAEWDSPEAISQFEGLIAKEGL